MARIAPAEVHGIWSVLLLYWHEDGSLDERAVEANLERTVAARPHGYYSLDTASEFYALEFERYRPLAERFVQRCRALDPKLPLGLGCTWTNQAGALQRIALARDLGVQTVHLSPPYWTPLNETGFLRFFAAVQEVAGDVGIVVYAPPWGRIDLTAELYRKLCAVAPCVIGTKASMEHPDLLDVPSPTARHSHFIGEPNLFEGMKRGASGAYSALSGLSLKFTKHWWQLMRDGKWTEAEAINQRVQRFYQEGVVPIRQRGILAGAIDKTMAELGGARGARRLLPPYESCPDDLRDGMRRAAQNHLPEALERYA